MISLLQMVKAAFLLLSGGIAGRRWGLRPPGTSKDLSDALDCLCFGQVDRVSPRSLSAGRRGEQKPFK